MSLRYTVSVWLLAVLLAPGCIFDRTGLDAPNGNNTNGNNANGNNANQNNTNQNNTNQNQASCGDGAIDSGEGCDDGNTEAADGCSDGCAVEHGYHCTGEPSVCHATCGDGLVAQGAEAEECDDGDAIPGDGCDAACEVESGWTCVGEGTDCTPICGDGLIVGTEGCDDGGANSDVTPNACRTDCQPAHCGDGVIDTDELCDGANFGSDSCANYPPADAGDLLCESNCTVVNSSDCHVHCPNHAACPLGQQCLNDRCTAVGNNCGDNPTLITASGSYTGTLENLTHDFCPNSDCMGSGPHDHGPDRWYAVTLQQDAYLIARLHPMGGWDAALGIITDCPDPLDDNTWTCSHAWNRADEPNAAERIDYVAEGGAATIFLVITSDDSEPITFGNYLLDIEIGGPTDSVDTRGQVVYSEMMPEPAGNPVLCEWFEIHNTTATARNLQDLDFYGLNDFWIGFPTVIPPHGYLLLARDPEPGDNCGLGLVDWYYTQDHMHHDLLTEHSIETDGNDVIDELAFTGDDNLWPYNDYGAGSVGTSMYLCTNHLDESDNDAPANWQRDSTNAYGTATNYGTPGAPNPGTCN